MAKKKIILSVHLTDKEQIWGIAYLLASIFLLPSALDYLCGLLPMPIGKSWFNFLYFTVNFLFIFMIFHGFFRRSLAYAGSHVGDFLVAVILGAGFYWLTSWGISLLYGRYFPEFGNLNDGSISQMAGDHFWITAVGTVLLVPIAEEALHRGLVFGCLYQKSHAAAYILSTIIFSSVHLMSYVGTYSTAHLALAFVQYIPAGLALAWAYRKSGSIFAPILMHAMINGISIFSLR